MGIVPGGIIGNTARLKPRILIRLRREALFFSFINIVFEFLVKLYVTVNSIYLPGEKKFILFPIVWLAVCIVTLKIL
jgi:hypothetical protein